MRFTVNLQNMFSKISVSEKLHEIIKRELKIKNNLIIQLVAIVNYTELNLAGE